MSEYMERGKANANVVTMVEGYRWGIYVGRVGRGRERRRIFPMDELEGALYLPARQGFGFCCSTRSSSWLSCGHYYETVVWRPSQMQRLRKLDVTFHSQMPIRYSFLPAFCPFSERGLWEWIWDGCI